MSAALPLSITRLIPLPLQDRKTSRSSGVWLQPLQWSDGPCRIFVRAPSGTGKTTLVHILYGLRTDYSGHVGWGSAELRSSDAEQVSRLRRESLSIVFQDMRLFPALTAWENLEIKRVLTNIVTQDEVMSWMARLGIADRADRPASTLSYGEQQRVAIIRALLQPFQWLLMDEPFSHLDTANTEKAAGLITDVVTRRNASLLLADLEDNDHFDYTQKLEL